MAAATLEAALLLGCSADESAARVDIYRSADGGLRDASGVDAGLLQGRAGSGGRGQGGSGGAPASGGATTSGGASASGGVATSGGAGSSSGGAAVKDGGDHDASELRDAAERDGQDARAVQDARAPRDATGDVGARDVGLDASGAGDAWSVCATDGATVERSWSPPDICTSTAMCSYTADPCSPSRCAIGGQCLRPVALPDGAPCDDGQSSTFTHPAKDGCPSSRCIGGANAGGSCASDSDCPGGSCFMNRCVDGPNAGAACETNADCTGGAPNANCVQQAGRKSFCDGGSQAGNFCPSLCDTTGGQCSTIGDPTCPRTCVGGTNPGTHCTPAGGQCLGGGVCTNHCVPVPNSPACPPAGRCVRWSADPTTGTCVATDDNPHCETVADCPTTKYCIGDPENQTGSSVDSCGGQVILDDCCLGGFDAGPCLVWDTCDTTHHVCVRTHREGQTATCGNVSRFIYGTRTCGAGPNGVGGRVCNDECRAGKCTSAYVECR